MELLIIGNVISLIAAGFRTVGCCMRDKERVFLYQFFECALLCVSACFFGAWAGLTTMVLSAARNLLVAKGKFTEKIMIGFVILLAVAGLLANNRGLIGLIPVVTTMGYTMCSYYIKGIKGTKYSLFCNVALWVIYSFLIYDFATAITDLVVLVVILASIVELTLKERQKKRAAAE